MTVPPLTLDRPFRLDLTVSALRRLPTNLVDVLTPEGAWLHAFSGPRRPLVTRIAQPGARRLTVTIEGEANAEETATVMALVRRTLGLDRDVRPFLRAATQVRWLDPLARHLRGLRPPRYRSLWEAVVNAVVFQQVSLAAASAIVQRLVLTVGTPLESAGVRVHAFPDTDRVLGAPDDTLQATGLSRAKVATLRRAGEAIASGVLDPDELEAAPSADAAAQLQRVKGIGPWTATVILLRGFGRLDVFPMNDSGVARSLALAAGNRRLDLPRLLERLHPQPGMLYYHLLLARLERRGLLGQPTP